MTTYQKLLYFFLGGLTVVLTILFLGWKDARASEIVISYYPSPTPKFEMVEMGSENYKLEVMEIE